MSVLSGIGGIIRNEKGELILDYAGGTLAHSLEEAELKALAKGIQLCHHIQATRKQIKEIAFCWLLLFTRNRPYHGNSSLFGKNW